jgi:hypothetical protein
VANVNRPNGFSPVANMVGGSNTGQARLYYIPSTDTNAYYIGDVVKSAEGADPTNLYPQCVKITASPGVGPVRGVIVGFYTNISNPSQVSVPATKAQAYYALVLDDPNQIFEITDDGLTSANTVAAAIGQNCQFTVAAPSVATNPYSATVLLSSSFSAGNAAYPCKIVGARADGQNAFGIYCRWYIIFNNHELKGGTGTVGA